MDTIVRQTIHRFHNRRLIVCSTTGHRTDWRESRVSRLICDQSLGINYKVGECDIAITLHSNKNKSGQGFILGARHVPAVSSVLLGHQHNNNYLHQNSALPKLTIIPTKTK